MKIIGFSQLNNELEKGNLLNWFKCMDSVCDEIFIYDQGSTDGSREEYKKHNTFVIESETNDFSNEIICKARLLEELLKKHPDAGWIFWMDGDTIMERKLLEPGFLKDTCAGVSDDSIILGHYNLWRSDVHYRVDNSYHALNDCGVVALWRNNGQLSFPKDSGLHHPQFPSGVSSKKRIDYSLIHRGFATDQSIINKYTNYRSRGQNGWALDRLVDEATLEVKLLPNTMLPEWFYITSYELPNNKNRLVEIYKDRI